MLFQGFLLPSLHWDPSSAIPFSCLLPFFPYYDKHPPILNIPSKIKEHPLKKIPLKALCDSWTPVAIPAVGLQIKTPIMDSFSRLWASGSPQKLQNPAIQRWRRFLAPALTPPAELELSSRWIWESQLGPRHWNFHDKEQRGSCRWGCPGPLTPSPLWWVIPDFSMFRWWKKPSGNQLWEVPGLVFIQINKIISLHPHVFRYQSIFVSFW